VKTQTTVARRPRSQEIARLVVPMCGWLFAAAILIVAAAVTTRPAAGQVPGQPGTGSAAATANGGSVPPSSSTLTPAAPASPVPLVAANTSPNSAVGNNSANTGALSPGGVQGSGASPANIAPAQAIGTRSLLQIMNDGGPLMYPIAACSIFTLVFVFERAIALRIGRVIPGPFVRRFLEQLNTGEIDRAKALELCEENLSPVSRVLAAAVKKWGKPAVEVEQAILDSGERVTNELRRYIRLFNAISTVSPLLGLLGTVFGMITCFNTIASADGMGRPELLAGGIGEAMLTTAAGLAVAIPALIAYWYFVSRVDQLVMRIDAIGQEVVEIISAEAECGDDRPDRGERGQERDKDRDKSRGKDRDKDKAAA
jgi:biopolymer transport protein ExbB